MNSNIIVGIVGIAVVVGGVIGADAYKASKDAEAAHFKADKLEKETARQRELTEKSEKDERALSEDLQPREAMGEEIDKWQVQENELLEQARAARAAWDDSVTEMQGLLKPLRATTETKPLLSVTLKSGNALRNCVIAGVEGGQIILKHQDGVTKVTPKDLPFELVRRYFLNFDPVLPPNLEVPELSPVMVVTPQAETPPPVPSGGPGKGGPAGKGSSGFTELARAEQKINALRFQLKQFEQAKAYQLSLCHLFANPPDNEQEKIYFAKGLLAAQTAGRRYVEKIKLTQAEIEKMDSKIGMLRARPGA